MRAMATRDRSASAEALIRAPADDLCLAFANTRFWRGSEAPTEQLHGIGDLVAWSRSAGGLPASPLEAWLAAWHGAAGDAATAFDTAVAVREAIYRAFHALAGGAAPAAA